MKYIKKPTGRLKEKKDDIIKSVEKIIDDVRINGDKAIKKYSETFDKSKRDVFKVSREEIDEAYKLVGTDLIEDIEFALKNIKKFANLQKDHLTSLDPVEISPGVYAGHRVIPVDSCLAYVPGGTYPLFSTALMLITPAKIAGVGRVVAASPVMKGTGSINPQTLVAMDLAGADEIYAIGGAQAIAGFSYGTESLERVDMVVGPGNAYVAEAKRQCFGEVGIDFIAGPSEVMVIADETGHAEIIAFDLLAQSEHDYNARAILVTTDEDLGNKVLEFIEKEAGSSVEDLPREAWKENGEIILVESLAKACEIANKWAPEHLEIMTRSPKDLVGKLRNYGSLFLGKEAAEVFGDYSSGTNHTLPTSGSARYTGGLWVGNFLKVLTYQHLNKEGLNEKIDLTARLARGEGLKYHEKAALARRTLLEGEEI